MPTVTIWHASWCAPCRGTLAALVPLLREEGVEPSSWTSTGSRAARGRRIDRLPTVTVDEGGRELMRCRGHPTEEAIERIIEPCTGG